jgi:hypothetical protein
MAEHKNQHIVPQHYLRGFSRDKEKETIYRYNMKKEVRPLIAIKNVCKSSYYYGKEEGLEQVLQMFEDMHAPILNKLITDRRVDWLTLEEIDCLQSFVLLLNLRTESARKLALNSFESMYTDIGQQYLEANNYHGYTVKVTINPAWAHYQIMKTLIEKSYVINDLRHILLINETGRHFVTSNNPVVFYNYKVIKNKHTACGGCSGLMIFCPLTENLLLLLVDKDLYDISEDTQTRILVKNEFDIDSINKLQLLNLSEEVYCYDESELDYIKELHSIVKDHITGQKIIKTKLEKCIHSDALNGEIYSTNPTDVNYKIKLSFIKFNKENNRKYKVIMKHYKKNNIPLSVTRDALLTFKK